MSNSYIRFSKTTPRPVIGGETKYDTVEVTTHSSQLGEVIEAFEDFLRASGFVFEGRLDLVDDGSGEDQVGG